MNNIPQPKYLNLEYFFNNFSKYLEVFAGKVVVFYNLLDTKTVKLISISAVVLLLVGIFMLIYKISEIRRRKVVSMEGLFGDESVPNVRDNRWNEIEMRLGSENPSDWKVAIMDADSLIDEILRTIGYQGETLGEILKSIEPSDFDNLQNVWEAHKIRNKIAHESGVEIQKEEVLDAMGKFKKALKELKYI